MCIRDVSHERRFQSRSRRHFRRHFLTDTRIYQDIRRGAHRHSELSLHVHVHRRGVRRETTRQVPFGLSSRVRLIRAQRATEAGSCRENDGKSGRGHGTRAAKQCVKYSVVDKHAGPDSHHTRRMGLCQAGVAGASARTEGQMLLRAAGERVRSRAQHARNMSVEQLF